MRYLLMLLLVAGCTTGQVAIGPVYQEQLIHPAPITNEQIDKDEAACKMRAYGLTGQYYNDFFTLCMQNLGYKLTQVEVK